MDSIYLIIKLHVRKQKFCFAFTACGHVSVMGSCSTSKVEEFPLLAEKINCHVAILFGYRMLPMVTAFSKSLCLALVQACHICAHTHTEKSMYFAKDKCHSVLALFLILSLAICYWPQLESGK